MARGEEREGGEKHTREGPVVETRPAGREEGRPIRAVQFGLGPIGQACVRELVGRAGVELVGGIDVDPEKAGRDLGEVCGLDRPLGVPVRADAEAALAALRPDVALHTTTSFLSKVADQLELLVGAGASVVSSTEELFWPWDRDRAFCARIDAAARRGGAAVVGTGVNPGFAMDLLPLSLTGVCTRVERIVVTRTVDAGRRRLPLRRKVGAGLAEEAFATRRSAGGFGHIGLEESARALAAGLGWPVDRLEETFGPVLAERRVETPGLDVEAGRVAGIHQTVRVESRGRERLVLDLKMYVGAEGSEDRIEIDGTPPLVVRAEGGIFGDTATVAALVNAIPLVLAAPPGLRTVLDLPVPRAFGT